MITIASGLELTTPVYIHAPTNFCSILYIPLTVVVKTLEVLESKDAKRKTTTCA